MGKPCYATAADINVYQQKICTYRKRRDIKKAKLIKMYGSWCNSGNRHVKNRIIVPIRDVKVIKRLTKKINWYQTMEKTIKDRKNAVIALANHVAYFTGYNVKNSPSCRREIANIARGIFCKWGLENGIKGVMLEEYMGYTKHSRAGETRLNFIKSFSKNNNNKEMWLRFKTYYKDAIEECKKNIE